MSSGLFVSVQERAYPFVNTPSDGISRLQEVLGGRLGVTGRSLGELVGEMVLRLAHDHILPLRITSYAQTVLQFSAQLNKHAAELQVCLTCVARSSGSRTAACAGNAAFFFCSSVLSLCVLDVVSFVYLQLLMYLF